MSASGLKKLLPLLAFTVFAVACDDGGSHHNLCGPPLGTVRFSMVGDATGDQNFVAITDSIALTELAGAEMRLPLAERTLLPIGPVDRGNGDGGHNQDWSWHFLRNEWNLTDSSDPSCDGNAVIVEQAVDHWVDTIGQFCPAGARVVSVTITQC